MDVIEVGIVLEARYSLLLTQFSETSAVGKGPSHTPTDRANSNSTV